MDLKVLDAQELVDFACVLRLASIDLAVFCMLTNMDKEISL